MVISKPFMALRLYPAGPGALLLTPFTVPGFNNVVDGAADTLGGDAGILPTPWVSLSMRLNGPQCIRRRRHVSARGTPVVRASLRVRGVQPQPP